jgi:hypothetical protein
VCPRHAGIHCVSVCDDSLMSLMTVCVKRSLAPLLPIIIAERGGECSSLWIAAAARVAAAPPSALRHHASHTVAFRCLGAAPPLQIALSRIRRHGCRWPRSIAIAPLQKQAKLETYLELSNGASRSGRGRSTKETLHNHEVHR